MKAKNLQDPDKTKAQLLDELTNLRQQVAELQATLNECRQTNQALGDKHQ